MTAVKEFISIKLHCHCSNAQNKFSFYLIGLFLVSSYACLCVLGPAIRDRSRGIDNI